MRTTEPLGAAEVGRWRGGGGGGRGGDQHQGDQQHRRQPHLWERRERGRPRAAVHSQQLNTLRPQEPTTRGANQAVSRPEMADFISACWLSAMALSSETQGHLL